MVFTWSSHALCAQGDTACTSSRSTWTTRYMSSGTAWRRASLAQMNASCAAAAAEKTSERTPRGRRRGERGGWGRATQRGRTRRRDCVSVVVVVPHSGVGWWGSGSVGSCTSSRASSIASASGRRAPSGSTERRAPRVSHRGEVPTTQKVMVALSVALGCGGGRRTSATPWPVGLANAQNVGPAHLHSQSQSQSHPHSATLPLPWRRLRGVVMM